MDAENKGVFVREYLGASEFTVIWRLMLSKSPLGRLFKMGLGLVFTNEPVCFEVGCILYGGFIDHFSCHVMFFWQLCNVFSLVFSHQM